MSVLMLPPQHFSYVSAPPCRARLTAIAETRYRVRCRSNRPLRHVALHEDKVQIERPLPLNGLGHMPVSFTSSKLAAPVRRVLCYGDSLTAGFCAQGRLFEPYGRTMAGELGRAGIPTEVLVCGHSGHTSAQMVANLDAYAVSDTGRQIGKGLRRSLSEAARQDLVVIMTGTNDLGQFFSFSAMLEDIAKLHQVCHLQGVPTVAVLPPPILSNPKVEANRRHFAELLQAWAKTVPNIQAVLDPSELVPATSSGSWDVDGVHFSPDGSRLLGQHLAAQVLPLLACVGSRNGNPGINCDS